MRIDINKMFYGYVKQVRAISYDTKKHPIARYLKKFKIRPLYQCEEQSFIDIKTNEVYSSNIHSSNIGDLVVDIKTLVPISTICDKLNIILPEKEKTSAKKLIKKIEKGSTHTKN